MLLHCSSGGKKNQVIVKTGNVKHISHFNIDLSAHAAFYLILNSCSLLTVVSCVRILLPTLNFHSYCIIICVLLCIHKQYHVE